MKDAFKLAKTEAVERIRLACGSLIDTPTSSGGNTDTGGIVNRFLVQKNRKDICSNNLKESDRMAFSKNVQLFIMVLAVSQHVDISKVAIPGKVRELALDRDFP